MTLGNQLEGINLCDPQMVARFKRAYPEEMAVAQAMLLTGRKPSEFAAKAKLINSSQAATAGAKRASSSSSNPK